MMNRCLAAVFVALFLSGCATKGHVSNRTQAAVAGQHEEGEVLAVVNGEEITIDDYNDKMQRLSVYEKAMYRGEKGHQEFLKALIQQSVMVQEAIKLGLDKDEEVQKKIQALMQEVTARVLVEALIKQEILDKVIVTDEEAKAYYDDHEEEFRNKGKVRIRQIIAATKEDAQKIREELEKGTDFAGLAEERSIDQHTAKKGGDIGYIERGRMPAELEKASFGLKVGEISNVMETRFGYHIIKLEDKQEASIKEFYEVSDEIKKNLISRKQRDEHQKWLRQLEEKADIEIKEDFGSSSESTGN